MTSQEKGDYLIDMFGATLALKCAKEIWDEVGRFAYVGNMWDSYQGTGHKAQSFTEANTYWNEVIDYLKGMQ